MEKRWFFCGIFRDKIGPFLAVEEGKKPVRHGASLIVLLRAEISSLAKVLQEARKKTNPPNVLNRA